LRCVKKTLRLRDSPVCYSRNGFRTVPIEETLARIDRVFLSTSFEVRVEKRSIAGTPFTPLLVHFLSPSGPDSDERYFGKGIGDAQQTASGVMEFFERFSSRVLGNELIIEAAYRDVKDRARDPREFVLAADSPYSPGRKIDWVWGYSLTEREPVLVPAILAFFPYTFDRPEKAFTAWDSNGLASGNCLEEAVLHGLLEVIERDARVIMEYNSLAMPDLELDGPLDPALSALLNDMEESRIACRLKDNTLDIPVPSIGAYLEGRSPKSSRVVGRGFSTGTHLHPEIAFSRALTEAIQLYPRSKNYREWMASSPISHLHREGKEGKRFSDIPDLSASSLRKNINICVRLLEIRGSEVIVVDLSLPEIEFPVVRVCATNLQPLIIPGCMRLSRRLFDVPVELGYREKPLQPADIKYRALCGYGAEPLKPA
jgi:ribosomal protein S12 methylthiotransferase accessory factor